MNRVIPAKLSNGKQEPPLPKPFKRPVNYPQHVQKALTEKMLYGMARTKLITTIAHEIYLCKSYTTEEEYLHIVQQMYKKWPFLDDGKGLVSYTSFFS